MGQNWGSADIGWVLDRGSGHASFILFKLTSSAIGAFSDVTDVHYTSGSALRAADIGWPSLGRNGG